MTDPLDYPAASLSEIAADQGDTRALEESPLQQQLNDHGRMIADLHGKLDNLAMGLYQVHTMVSNLVQMLSAVQQVAAMMPGGKRFARAMAEQVSQNGSSNGTETK